MIVIRNIFVVGKKTRQYVNLQKEYHGIIEYSDLEKTQKGYQVQILALHRTAQESHHVPENIVQMLLEVWQAGAVTTSMGGLFQCLITLWVKNLSNLSLS